MRKKGSLTVEAAFVVPLAFFAVMVFLQLFLFLQVQMRLQKELAAVGDELMSLGTVFDRIQTDKGESGDSTGITAIIRQLGAEEYLKYRMREQIGGEGWLKHIRNGIDGLSFTGSSVYDGDMEIRILLSYSYVFNNTLFSPGGIPVKQQLVARGFGGQKREKAISSNEEEEEEEKQVFIAETGTVYHRTRECTYLKPDIRTVTPAELPGARNSSGGKYYPCEYCEEKEAGSVYYITPYGTRYHTTVSCQGLLRTVTALSEEEAASRGYRPCSKCGGTE